MKNIKKILISFIISLVIVIVVQLVWSKFNENTTSIHIATKDIYKGEKILQEDIKEIKVNSNREISKYSNVEIKNKIAKENIASGKILESSDITSEKVKENIDESYEYVTIEVKDISDSLAYQLKKGDYINVYYTAKNKKLDSILINKGESIETDSNITFRLFENIKVIGLYDSSGIEVNNGKQYKAIMLRVKKEEALLVSNIKSDGLFTISTVK